MAEYEITDGLGIIPEGTAYIVENAFKGCKKLTSIVIPDSVTEIGYNAFKGCTGLTTASVLGPMLFSLEDYYLRSTGVSLRMPVNCSPQSLMRILSSINYIK